MMLTELKANLKGKEWAAFTKERFHPPSHFIMIVLFLLAHFTLFKLKGALVAGPWEIFLLFLGTTFFFFKLRLFDELKDFELDVVINPDRPLPRGLVSHQDVYRMIGVCIALEMLSFGLVSGAALLSMVLTILYSLLMYKEFFIREKIRPHLTTYALTHTVVTIPLTYALGCGLTGKNFWEMDPDLLVFSLNNWFLFNLFEFGRKTFLGEEEREGVESYSKIFGRLGAVVLGTVMSLGPLFFLLRLSFAGTLPLFPWFLALEILFVLMGGLLVAVNAPPFGKLYRGISSVYIILILMGFSFLGLYL